MVMVENFLELSSTPDPPLYQETLVNGAVFHRTFSGTSTLLFIYFFLLKYLNYVARKPGGD